MCGFFFFFSLSLSLSLSFFLFHHYPVSSSYPILHLPFVSYFLVSIARRLPPSCPFAVSPLFPSFPIPFICPYPSPSNLLSPPPPKQLGPSPLQSRLTLRFPPSLSPFLFFISPPSSSPLSLIVFIIYKDISYCRRLSFLSTFFLVCMFVNLHLFIMSSPRFLFSCCWYFFFPSLWNSGYCISSCSLVFFSFFFCQYFLLYV